MEKERGRDRDGGADLGSFLSLFDLDGGNDSGGFLMAVCGCLSSIQAQTWVALAPVLHEGEAAWAAFLFIPVSQGKKNFLIPHGGLLVILLTPLSCLYSLYIWRHSLRSGLPSHSIQALFSLTVIPLLSLLSDLCLCSLILFLPVCLSAFSVLIYILLPSATFGRKKDGRWNRGKGHIWGFRTFAVFGCFKDF